MAALHADERTGCSIKWGACHCMQLPNCLQGYPIQGCLEDQLPIRTRATHAAAHVSAARHGRQGTTAPGHHPSRRQGTAPQTSSQDTGHRLLMRLPPGPWGEATPPQLLNVVHMHACMHSHSRVGCAAHEAGHAVLVERDDAHVRQRQRVLAQQRVGHCGTCNGREDFKVRCRQNTSDSTSVLCLPSSG